MNLKIRVGFKSDPNTGHPLFCPVYVESFAAAVTRLFFLCSHEPVQERMGPDGRQNYGESFCVVHNWLLTSCLQVVEIQVQLKVRRCTPVFCTRNWLSAAYQLSKLIYCCASNLFFGSGLFKCRVQIVVCENVSSCSAQDLYDCYSQHAKTDDSFHENYIQARNLMSQ
jgi:hypothetical protein